MRRRLTLLSAVVLLATVVIATAAGGAWTLDPVAIEGPTPELPPLDTEPPQPQPSPQAYADGDFTVLAWAAAGLAALIAVALLTLVVVWIVRQVRLRGTAPAPEPGELDIVPPGASTTVPVLSDAVDVALARLDAATTTHDAVIAAWVSLEEAAAAHGWERQRSQTSTEYTTHLLDVSPAPPEPAATLRRLYQQARFTTHPVTDAQVAQARTALQAIARSLDGQPVTPRLP